MKHRWTNWDQLAVGEDFWDAVDELDEKRKGEIREHRQMDAIRKAHERRLSKMKIDREKFMSEEPYSFMCKIPCDADHVAPIEKTTSALPRTIVKRRTQEQILQDEQIIHSRWPEICLLLARRTGRKAVAARLGVSHRVLVRVISSQLQEA